jgi:hypothetical protein
MMNWFAEHVASGLFASTWNLVWHFGVGVGLLILCLAGAFFSPIGKSSFLIAAGAIVGAMALYAYGINNERQNCDARVRFIYLKAHPKLNKTNLSPGWTVSPKWTINSPVTYSSDVKPPCGPMEWGCQ